jgi:peptide chain release factor 3
VDTLAAEVASRRTFAIISHPDAGKTTLTEKLLLLGGAIQLAGQVKGRRLRRHTHSDWMRLERERGISVTTSVMQFPYGGCLLNLLDTPGHEDFSEDTYRTLSAVDSALMVIDAAKGVEERTLKLMEVARRRNTPVMTFINKMDREGLPPLALLDEIEKKLGLLTVPFTWPIGQGRELLGIYHLHEDWISVYRADDHAHAGFVERIEGLASPAGAALLGPSAARLGEECELVRGTLPAWNPEDYAEGLATPVFFGSALGGFGVRELLDAFCTFAPPPRPQWSVSRTVRPEEPALSGFVFKIQANLDPQHHDRMAFVRLCSGRYAPGMRWYQVRTGRSFKVTDARTFFANARTEAGSAVAGDIIGLPNHGTIQIGDVFTEGERLSFAGVPNFAPEWFRRVILDDPLRSKTLARGLEELAEEGAAQFFRPLVGQEWIVGAIGPLQFEVVAARLADEYAVRCRFEPMPIATARWVESAPDRLEQLKSRLAPHLANDHLGDLVYLAPSRVHLELTEERHPDVRFHKTRERVLA